MGGRIKPRNPLAERFANRTAPRPASHKPRKGKGSYDRRNRPDDG